VIGIYNAFESGVTPSFSSTLHSIASTVTDCLSGATHSIPIIGTIISFIKAACSIDDIYNNCSPLVTALEASTFVEYDVGYASGTCMLAIASAMSRRSTPANVPAEWLCQASYYNSSDGCDVGCGAFDPDCYSAVVENLRTFYPRGKIEAPVAWTCPIAFYGSSDGCDNGCGAVDPDCLVPPPSGRRYIDAVASSYTWNASQDFQITALRMYALQLQATANGGSSGSGGVASEYKPITIVIAAVLGSCLVVLAVLVVVFRRRKARVLVAEEALRVALLDDSETPATQ